MTHYQNQYGAVPASKDPIQKEMDTTGDTTGVGGSTQIIADEYDRTTADTIGVSGASHAAGEGEHHHKKKGIIEKIKEKLPGTHHHNKSSGVMIGAASRAIWNNRAACGKKYKVKCLGKASYPCKAGKEVVITIVNHCPRCGVPIDSSREAFGSIAALNAGRINIELQPL